MCIESSLIQGLLLGLIVGKANNDHGGTGGYLLPSDRGMNPAPATEMWRNLVEK